MEQREMTCLMESVARLRCCPHQGGSEMVWLRARSASDAAAIESPRVAAAQGPGVCTLHLQPIGRSFSSPVTKEWWLNTVRY